MENVELEIGTEALAAIAHKAMERKTGARGLRSIVEQTLLDTMFELPAMEGIAKVVVSKEVITAAAKPEFVPVTTETIAAS